MPAPIACPSCGHRFQVNDPAAGRPVKCPKCSKPLTVRVPGRKTGAERPVQPPPLAPEPTTHVLGCPGCLKQLAFDARWAGQAARCPQCGTQFRVPAAAGAGPAPAAERQTIKPWGPVSPPRDEGDGNGPGQPPPLPVRHPGRGAPLGLGIASLGLGAVALALTPVPAVGAWAMLPASLGLCLAAAGAIVAVIRGRRGISLPAGGSALNVAALVVGLIVLAHKDAKTAQANDNLQTAGGPGSGGGTKEAAPFLPVGNLPGSGDIDASKNALTYRGMRVEVSSATTDFVVGRDFEAFISKKKFLLIRLRIQNLSTTRKVEYRGWGVSEPRGGEKARLSDNLENRYQLANFGPLSRVEGQVRAESIYPEKTLEDLLVFETPVDRAEFLTLELPAANFGEDGVLRLRIPASMVDAEAKAKARQEEEMRRFQEAERQRALEAERQKALRQEREAAAKLKAAQKLVGKGNGEAAKEAMRQVLRDYPGTRAAEEARQWLDVVTKREAEEAEKRAERLRAEREAEARRKRAQQEEEARRKKAEQEAEAKRIKALRAAEAERAAGKGLQRARGILEDSAGAKRENDFTKAAALLRKAKVQLQDLAEKYPETKAAPEARDLLDRVEDLQKAVENERVATGKLRLLKRLVDEGAEMLGREGDATKGEDFLERAEPRLARLIRQYPKTRAAGEARELLKKVRRLLKR